MKTNHAQFSSANLQEEQPLTQESWRADNMRTQKDKRRRRRRKEPITNNHTDDK